MTDYIEILLNGGNMRSLLVLHDHGNDVGSYLTCSSDEIGSKLEERIRARFGSMCAVVSAIRLNGHKESADALDCFIEAAHRMCGDDKSDGDIYDFQKMARAFLSEHVITIKDH